MNVIPRNHPHVLPVVGTSIAILVTAFLAVRLMGTSGEAKPQLAATAKVGDASGKPTARPKEQIRYQATIENWRRYRAANDPN